MNDVKESRSLLRPGFLLPFCIDMGWGWLYIRDMIRILRVEDLKGEGPYNYSQHTIEMRRAHNNNPLTPSPWDDGLDSDVLHGRMYFGFDSEESFLLWFGGWEAELNAAGYVLTEWEVDDSDDENFAKGGHQIIFLRENARKLDARPLVEGPQRKPEHRFQRGYYDEHDDGQLDWVAEQSDKVRARSRESAMQQAYLYSKQLMKGSGSLYVDGVLTSGSLRVEGYSLGGPFGKNPSIAQKVRDGYPRWTEQMKQVEDSWTGPDWIKKLAEEAPLITEEKIRSALAQEAMGWMGKTT